MEKQSPWCMEAFHRAMQQAPYARRNGRPRGHPPRTGGAQPVAKRLGQERHRPCSVGAGTGRTHPNDAHRGGTQDVHVSVF
eukprot:2312523-Pyramimonas_sp.AAC.1